MKPGLQQAVRERPPRCDDANVLTPEMLGRTFAEAPDPELARVAFSRVGDDPVAREALARPEVTEVASRLLGFSSAAADFLVAHPDEVDALADVSARPASDLRAELDGDLDRLGSRGRASAVPASGDAARGRARSFGRSARRGRRRDQRDRRRLHRRGALRLSPAHTDLAVIGLGKLGGHELNYASDVDLRLPARRSGLPLRRKPPSATVASLTALLAEPTAEGIALRVDVALRPGGRGGALSRSLEAMIGVLRARVGDLGTSGDDQGEAGRRRRARSAGVLLAGVEPFVYPRELAPAAIEDVRRTKVRLEEYVRRRGKELTEVKRGRGGIRDVEFAVQLLQIVHGRARSAAAHPESTLAALRRSGAEGYVADADAAALADAYRFLRRVEHRLQIVRDLQTHDLPPDRHARTTLARSLGLPTGPMLWRPSTSGPPGSSARSTSGLFYRPLLESFAGPAQLAEHAVPSHGTDRPATEELLAGLGFAEPGRSYDVLGRLVDPASPNRQGAREPVPGRRAGARALADARRCARPSGTHRRGGGRLGDGQDRTVADVLATDPSRPAASPTWSRRARSRPTCWWPIPHASAA